MSELSRMEKRKGAKARVQSHTSGSHKDQPASRESYASEGYSNQPRQGASASYGSSPQSADTVRYNGPSSQGRLSGSAAARADIIEQLVRERPTGASSGRIFGSASSGADGNGGGQRNGNGGGPKGPTGPAVLSDPGASPAPQRKPKKKAPRLLAYLLLVSLLAVFTYAGYQIFDFIRSPFNVAEGGNQGTGGTGTDSGTPGSDDTTPGAIPDEFAKTRIDILLLGVDERVGEPSRSDTIILASLFPQERQVKMLSIPRDTRVLIPGYGNDKINHAHVYGGVNLVRDTVEQFTGIPIDYYVETNFQGFINMIDILGGVTINEEKKMYYPDENIDLEPGLQTLNGYNSLAYVRFRSDGMGDIGRVARQQHFLKVLAENTLRTSTIAKIPDLVGELRKNVKTDLSIIDMVSLANRFSKMQPSDIEAWQVPGFNGMQNEISYWIPDLNATKKIVDGMKRPTKKTEEAPATP